MRDRNVMAVYVLGTLSIVGGIVLYNNLGHDDTGSQLGDGPSERVEVGEGINIELSLPRFLLEREQPAESGPVRRPTEPPAVHTPMSSARGGAPAPAARPAIVPVQSPCAQSLLGSVLGLLGGLLGGGGC